MIVNIILICGKCRGKQKYKGYNTYWTGEEGKRSET